MESTRAETTSTGVMWLAAATVAALGTWICFDALPGINWLLWTAAAGAGLLFLTRAPRPVVIMTGLAIVIAGGAAVSANEIMWVLIVMTATLCLAIATLLTADPSFARITAGFTVAAPIVAFTHAAISAVKRAAEATEMVRSPGARAGIRGVVITLPVLVVFALLLSVADPTFASWRDAIDDLLSNWDFLPRTIFFFALLALVIGAYGYAVRASASSPASHTAGTTPSRWLGSSERLILVGGVTALLWIFLLVQLSYLFGNLPDLPNSGVTFADYARRGFGELTIVAVMSTLLIVACERYGRTDGRQKLFRMLTFALILAVLLVLGSAFRRVLLYEAAYGYTTARLYAKAFMLVIAAGLVALAIEVAGDLEPGRFFRRLASIATIVLIGLIYWNHEAWIAHRNIDRYATTGKLDASYLTRDLSPDAVPAIIGRLPSLPEPMQSEVRAGLVQSYRKRMDMFDRRWFNWNLRGERAKEALEKLPVPPLELSAEAPRTRPRTQPSPASQP